MKAIHLKKATYKNYESTPKVWFAMMLEKANSKESQSKNVQK